MNPQILHLLMVLIPLLKWTAGKMIAQYAPSGSLGLVLQRIPPLLSELNELLDTSAASGHLGAAPFGIPTPHLVQLMEHFPHGQFTQDHLAAYLDTLHAESVRLP